MPRVRYILLLFCLFLSACVERINFEVDRKPGQVVIDGSMTNEAGVQVVRVGKTAAIPRIPIPVEDAKVRIFDDQGNMEAYVHDSERPGTYVLPEAIIRGEVGRSYFVEVELIEGKVYRSRPEIMQAEQVIMESIAYDFSVEKDVSSAGIVSENTYINTYIDVDLSQTDSSYYLKWDVEETFLLTPTDFPDPFGNIPPPCFVYAYTSAIDLNLFNGLNSPIQRLEGLKVASKELDWTFREKHYFTVRQKHMTQEAYEYWEKAENLLSSVGSIFDIPPAPIPGNLYNVNDESEEVLGYFDVSSSSLMRFRTFRHDIPVDQILECTYEPRKRYNEYPNYCLDCLSVRHSQYKRPDFF